MRDMVNSGLTNRVYRKRSIPQTSLMQCLAKGALRQHGMQMLQKQRFDFRQHGPKPDYGRPLDGRLGRSELGSKLAKKLIALGFAFKRSIWNNMSRVSIDVDTDEAWPIYRLDDARPLVK